MGQDKDSYWLTPAPLCTKILLTKMDNMQAAYDITTNLLENKY